MSHPQTGVGVSASSGALPASRDNATHPTFRTAPQESTEQDPMEAKLVFLWAISCWLNSLTPAHLDTTGSVSLEPHTRDRHKTPYTLPTVGLCRSCTTNERTNTGTVRLFRFNG